MKIGVLALGRATFDIEFANQKLSECISFLKKTSYSIIGGDEILLESNTTQNEAERLQNENVDFQSKRQVYSGSKTCSCTLHGHTIAHGKEHFWSTGRSE